MPISREQVMSALRTVQDPELFKDIVSLNMVKDVRLDGDDVFVNVELTTPACPPPSNRRGQGTSWWN